MLDITLAESTLEFINYNFPISLDKKVMDQIRRIHESKYAMLSKKGGESVLRIHNSASSILWPRCCPPSWRS
jgi:hypothetical protein